MKTTSRKCGESRGYTLIEIMIVVIIIGILASMAVPSFKSARENSHKEHAKYQLALLSAAVDKLAWDTGRYPGYNSPLYKAPQRGPWTKDLQECTNLRTAYAGICHTGSVAIGGFPADSWKGPYLSASAIPLDPWGLNYFFDPDYYVWTNSAWRIYAVVGSYGPNKRGRNVYDSDDIIDIIERRL